MGVPGATTPDASLQVGNVLLDVNQHLLLGVQGPVRALHLHIGCLERHCRLGSKQQTINRLGKIEIREIPAIQQIMRFAIGSMLLWNVFEERSIKLATL